VHDEWAPGDSGCQRREHSSWARLARGLLRGSLLALMSALVVLVLWSLAQALPDRHQGVRALGVVTALGPSLVLVGYRLLGARRTVEVRREEVAQYQEFLALYVERRTDGKLPPIFSKEPSDELLEQENHTRNYLFLFGALLFAVPFVCLALLLTTKEVSVLSSQGLHGLALTGAGIYAYTLGLAMFRIRTAAVSSEFLMSATLRAFIFMSVGYTLGSQGFFGAGSSASSAFLYFGIGLFPYLGMDMLGRRLKQAFAPDAPGTSPLKLQYVDGITEQVAERLEEVGIFDIQHLARAEPGWLSLRTLYPLSRITDWMDQAILIAYLREDIIHARQVGIRGAVDMRAIYQDALRAGGSGEKGFAQRILQELSSKSHLSQDALQAIGAALKDDILSDLLACLESGRCRPKRKKASAGNNVLDGMSQPPRRLGSRGEECGRAAEA
jgi:hypothetical protein